MKDRKALTFEHAMEQRDRWNDAVDRWRRNIREAWEEAGRPVSEHVSRENDPGTLALVWAHRGADGDARIVSAVCNYHSCGSRRDTWQEVAELLCPGHEWREEREFGGDVGLICTRCDAAEVG